MKIWTPLHKMGTGFLSLSFLFIAACERGETQQSSRDANALVDEIEAVTLEYELSPSNPSLNLIEDFSQMPKLSDAVTFIENNATLPNRARELKTYHRYYSRGTKGSEFGLVAIYVGGKLGKPHQEDYIKIPNMNRAYFVHSDDLPVIFDGGCSVITIHFNLKNMEFLKTEELVGGEADRRLYDGRCNGTA